MRIVEKERYVAAQSVVVVGMGSGCQQSRGLYPQQALSSQVTRPFLSSDQSFGRFPQAVSDGRSRVS